jgi:hypothetical protein
MARYREALSKDHFDLLPFIAVLMYTLGCLLLVTMSMAALSIGPGVGEGWIPIRDPKLASKIPILIEWDGTTAILHLEGRKIPIKWSKPSGIRLPDGRWLALPAEQEGDSAKFQKFLDELEAKRETHYALFAVRPPGFATFNRFAAEFRRRNITIGSEPIAHGKPVRLFRKEP